MMKNSHVFGDGTTLTAAARLYNQPITIFSPDATSFVQHIDLPASVCSQPAMYLGLYDEHYVSVHPDGVEPEKLPSQIQADTTMSPSASFECVPDNADSERNVIVINFACDTLPVFDIGSFVGKSPSDIDDFTKCQLIRNHWKPPDAFKFPFSVHQKRAGQKKDICPNHILIRFRGLCFHHLRTVCFVNIAHYLPVVRAVE